MISAAVGLLVLALVSSCSTGSSSSSTTTGATAIPMVGSDDAQAVTPVVGTVLEAPVSFAGSDGMTHLVYELLLTNAGRSPSTIEGLKVTDATSGETIQTLDRGEVASRFAVVGNRSPGTTLDAGQAGVLYVHLAVDPGSVPIALGHVLTIGLDPAANPAGTGIALSETLRPVAVDARPIPDLGPPLKGDGFIAADGCCDSTRHVRALLPINGALTIAQRYAIDWEQIDSQGRIYSGDSTDPASYTIFGKEALAVAAGTVVRVIDGLPEQVPGTFPVGISVEDADGNAVILDLGAGNFVMYAHLQPGSPRVKIGDRVAKGDVLGLVGNSGNSVAPHLHIHLMDSPLSLASNGLPYAIDRFTIIGRAVSTAAFDRAEAEGTPIEYTKVDPPTTHSNQYPMDQSIVNF